jgi:hypothetical protein
VAEVRERHRERAVLHLPDVAELVDDQVVAGLRDGLAEEDGVPRGVAVEAPEPREPEEQRRRPQPDAADPDGLGVEVEPVQTRRGARECLGLDAPRPQAGGGAPASRRSAA